jgi:hypothetical protein
MEKKAKINIRMKQKLLAWSDERKFVPDAPQNNAGFGIKKECAVDMATI